MDLIFDIGEPIFFNFDSALPIINSIAGGFFIFADPTSEAVTGIAAHEEV